MSYTRRRGVNFGASKGGLADVGYTLTGGTRQHPVAEVGTNTGAYSATITFPDGFVGDILWDSGEGSPVYALGCVNPGDDENSDAKTSSRSSYGGGDTAGTTTLLARVGGAITISGGKVDANVVTVGGSAATVAATVDANLVSCSTDAIQAAGVAAGAVAKVQAGLATPTNITGGTITTVTNLTNAPTAGDLTATMKASVTTAATAATPSVTVSDKTGFALAQAFPANFAALGITAGGKVSGVVLADTLTTYTGNTPQTGDAFARVGANGAGLTALAPASTALSNAVWTNAKAAFVDASISGVSAGGSSTSDIAAAVWAAGPRTLTDKAGFSLTPAYDPAKAAAQAGDAMTLTSGERAAIGTATWATTTRVLSAGTNIVLAKGTGLTGLNDITAASVWGVTRSGNQATGTFGQYIDASIAGVSGGGGGASLSDIVDGVAAQVTTDHGAGSYVRNTEPPTPAQVRAEIDASSTAIAAIAASLGDFAGLMLLGEVAEFPSPSTTAFKVTLDTPIDAASVPADFEGAFVTFRSGARKGVTRQVMACTINATTSLSLTFAPAAAFPAAPSDGDLLAIYS